MIKPKPNWKSYDVSGIQAYSQCLFQDSSSVTNLENVLSYKLVCFFLCFSLKESPLSQTNFCLIFTKRRTWFAMKSSFTSQSFLTKKAKFWSNHLFQKYNTNFVVVFWKKTKNILFFEERKEKFFFVLVSKIDFRFVLFLLISGC